MRRISNNQASARSVIWEDRGAGDEVEGIVLETEVTSRRAGNSGDVRKVLLNPQNVFGADLRTPEFRPRAALAWEETHAATAAAQIKDRVSSSSPRSQPGPFGGRAASAERPTAHRTSSVTWDRKPVIRHRPSRGTATARNGARFARFGVGDKTNLARGCTPGFAGGFVRLGRFRRAAGPRVRSGGWRSPPPGRGSSWTRSTSLLLCHPRPLRTDLHCGVELIGASARRTGPPLTAPPTPLGAACRIRGVLSPPHRTRAGMSAVRRPPDLW